MLVPRIENQDEQYLKIYISSYITQILINSMLVYFYKRLLKYLLISDKRNAYSDVVKAKYDVPTYTRDLVHIHKPNLLTRLQKSARCTCLR